MRIIDTSPEAVEAMSPRLRAAVIGQRFPPIDHAATLKPKREVAPLKTSEASLLRAVEDYLDAKKIVWIRVNPIKVVRGKSGIIFAPTRQSQKGVADLIIMVAGISVAVETKSSIGVLSPDQKAWGARWHESGGLYVVVRSFTGFLAALQEIKRV